MGDTSFSWDEGDQGDRCLIRGPGARIALDRSAGRWSHQLDLGDALPDGGPPLIASVETEPDHADPARVVSPVYQELQRHSFAGDAFRGICVLLTGLLFQHHFSAAFSVFRDPSEPRRMVLDVDLADRCRAPVASLAATYLVQLGEGSLRDAGERRLVWSTEHLEHLELACDAPGSLVLAEAGPSAARVQIVAGLHPTLFTHRLRYRWSWLAGNGPGPGPIAPAGAEAPGA